MISPKSNMLTPIAAALAIALASGGAMAANSQQYENQQSTNNQSMDNESMKSMDHQSTDQQSDNRQSANDMDRQSMDVYREGQLWATYIVNPVLQSYRIDTDVQGDKVILTGTVDTKPEKLLAATIAQQVKGVTTVENNIKVDPTVVVVTTFVPANAFAQHARNATISAKVNSKLLWNEYTDGLDIDVATRNGKVTLTGAADTQKAKKRAAEIAASTPGVRSVDNKITVSGDKVAKSMDMVNDDWITDKILASYRFTAGMDHGDIDVDVNNGTVVLSGTVDSKMERRRAINIAQHILGVDAVKADGLQVNPDNVAMN